MTENLESNRLQSEIARINAETEKLIIEREAIEQQANQKWYQARFFLEAIVGGIVAAGLIAAWGINYLQPLLIKKQELAVIDNQIIKKEALLIQQRNTDERKSLDIENAKIKQELEELLSKNRTLLENQRKTEEVAKDLGEKYKVVSDKYSELSEKYNLSKTERDEFAALARSSQKQVTLLKEQLGEISQSIEKSESQEKAIEDKLKTRPIIGLDIYIWHDPRHSKLANNLNDTLSNIGANIIGVSDTDSGISCSKTRLQAEDGGVIYPPVMEKNENKIIEQLVELKTRNQKVDKFYIYLCSDLM